MLKPSPLLPEAPTAAVKADCKRPQLGRPAHEPPPSAKAGSAIRERARPPAAGINLNISSFSPFLLILRPQDLRCRRAPPDQASRRRAAGTKPTAEISRSRRDREIG